MHLSPHAKMTSVSTTGAAFGCSGVVSLRIYSILAQVWRQESQMPKFVLETTACAILTSVVVVELLQQHNPCAALLRTTRRESRWMHIPCSVLPSFLHATSSRVCTQWHIAQSPKPSLWPLVTGIYPIPSAGSVSDDLFFFMHAFIFLITFGFNS